MGGFLTVLLQTQMDPDRAERYRRIMEQFTRPKPEAAWEILSTLSMLAAAPLLGLLLLRIQRRMKRGPVHRPARLLWDLAAHVPLAWSDRILLLRAARRAGLAAPAAVLLSANCYDRVVREWLARGHGRSATRLQRIRDRLFAE